MSASKAQRALTAQRRAKAWQLRLAGATLDEIAEGLGYAGRAAVSKDLSRSLQAAETAEANARHEWRELEIARLDRLQRGAWAAGVAGEPKSAAIVLACIDRRIKLRGLAAPVQVESDATVKYIIEGAELENLT